MGRPKTAIAIIQKEIKKLGFREDYNLVKGMIQMAFMLDRIDLIEREEMNRLLDEKYEELIY
jgi:hypothetical protein